MSSFGENGSAAVSSPLIFGSSFGTSPSTVTSNGPSIEELHKIEIRLNPTTRLSLQEVTGYDNKKTIAQSLYFKDLLDKISNINKFVLNFNLIEINDIPLKKYFINVFNVDYFQHFIDHYKSKLTNTFYINVYLTSCFNNKIDYVKCVLENTIFTDVNFNTKNMNGQTGYDLVRDKYGDENPLIKFLQSNSRIDTPIKLLEKQLKESDKHLEESEKKLEELEKKNTELEEKISKSEEKSTTLKKEMTELKKENTSLKRKINKDNTTSKKKCKV
jgi:prefoldin subunit 5